jgi:hypothetical protein
MRELGKHNRTVVVGSMSWYTGKYAPNTLNDDFWYEGLYQKMYQKKCTSANKERPYK